MADITGADVGNIKTQETEFKAAVSEYVMTRFGKLLNFFRATVVLEHKFQMNGRASYFANKQGVDGIFVLPYNAEILDVIIDNQTVGSTGQHEFDLKYSTFPNGAWTSLLTVTPKITTSAAAFATCGIGDVVTGCTAAQITAAALTLTAKTRLRLDVITGMSGSTNAALTIKFRPR